MNKRKYFVQGLTLAFISVFLRTTNIFYRSYLTDKIGADGLGLYQLIFSVFTLAVTLSTSGISLAVTRLVTSAISSGEREKIPSIVTKCFLFCLFLSGSISVMLVVFSDPAAEYLLGNIKASDCLKILGIGLPFMSICTCTKGYFLAVDEGVTSGAADTLEQIITIGSTIAIFNIFALRSMESACMGAMIASTLGEASSFIWNFTSYRISIRRNSPGKRKKSTGVFHGLTHIALPCTLSSAARSSLSTAENLLIPVQLQKNGSSYSSAMAGYGILQGMAAPILYFPSSFLFSFAFLLIPKISSERDLGHRKHVAYITERAISSTVSFGVICAAIFFLFGDEFGKVFYNSTECGRYISILSPLIPLMYLDVVVDNILKGLDLQFNSMIYNLADSGLRVLLILAFMAPYGIKAYICVIFFSTIFNAALSIRKMAIVSEMRGVFLSSLIYKIPIAALSVFVSSFIPFTGAVSLALHIIVSILLYFSAVIFIDIIKKRIGHTEAPDAQ